MRKKALLFVNGEPPKHYPDELNQYAYIACTDGAYHNYLTKTHITPHFIIGDLDSIHQRPVTQNINVIHTPDQNKTDFEKALLFLAEKGATAFDIYGATGNATDHFLGNLSVALQYYKQWNLVFFDHYCRFFFAQSRTTLIDVEKRIISLIPLTPVKNLTISGFKYPLICADLALGGLTSLRNQATENSVNITFDSGDLLVFIES